MIEEFEDGYDGLPNNTTKNEQISIQEAFYAAENAAEYLGNILNEMDAVEEKDIAYTVPLFDIIHRYRRQPSEDLVVVQKKP